MGHHINNKSVVQLLKDQGPNFNMEKYGSVKGELRQTKFICLIFG